MAIPVGERYLSKPMGCVHGPGSVPGLCPSRGVTQLCVSGRTSLRYRMKPCATGEAVVTAQRSTLPVGTASPSCDPISTTTGGGVIG